MVAGQARSRVRRKDVGDGSAAEHGRAPPWASRYLPERSCLSRVMASARSPAAIIVSPQSADASESEKTTLGISFIGVANGPDAPGQWAAIAVGGGPHEVRAGVAHRLDSPAEGVIGAPAAIQPVLPSTGATKPSSETDIFRTSAAMRCFPPGMDDTSCSSLR